MYFASAITVHYIQDRKVCLILQKLRNTTFCRTHCICSLLADLRPSARRAYIYNGLRRAQAEVNFMLEMAMPDFAAAYSSAFALFDIVVCYLVSHF